MATFLNLTEVDIQLLQLLATVIGGLFALLLLNKSNQDKRLTHLLSIFNKLYNDPDIAKALYAIDKRIGLNELAAKQITDKYNVASLEMETDKLLKYLDFVGALLKAKKIKCKDLEPFGYEFKIIKENTDLIAYRKYLKTIDVKLNNLDYLLNNYK
ncbi:hypothetical protein [Pedobacter mucosus]|uniref:hypothetical protein n=1 Tax=Pedobacter mucosus TaxID=2895286 RepID=UPI001EE47E61|nr:hypothetical protein [Pedobacter mucosus]UKT66021.1 hypothetical protein LOK61_09560 [Pedobacter mucosus]